MDCVLLLFRDTCGFPIKMNKFMKFSNSAKNVTESMQSHDLVKIMDFHENADFHDFGLQNH